MPSVRPSRLLVETPGDGENEEEDVKNGVLYSVSLRASPLYSLVIYSLVIRKQCLSVYHESEKTADSSSSFQSKSQSRPIESRWNLDPSSS